MAFVDDTNSAAGSRRNSFWKYLPKLFQLVKLIGLGDGKACSEVEKRLLLHLATNFVTFDHANGSIGFVSGPAGQGLADKHAPTSEVLRPSGNLQKTENFFMALL